MRAYATDKFGAPGDIRELPAPEPAEGQVQIRVAAAGVNPFDIAVLNGSVKDYMEHRFPLIPGLDAAGTIEAVGPGVTDWKVGDEVFGAAGKGFQGEGTVAQTATLSASSIAAKPANVDWASAAAVPTPAVTALTLLDAAKVKAGDTIVALGASGGVGTFVTQLGSIRGARVIAVCRGNNADYVRSLGALEVIDYTAGDVAKAVEKLGGADVVIDMVGDKATVTGVAGILRDGGRVASSAGGIDADALTALDITGENVQARVSTEALTSLAASLGNGTLKAPNLTSFALDQTPDALALVASKHTRGKVVVTP